MNGHYEAPTDRMCTSDDEEELFDVLRPDNHQPAGRIKLRSAVHRDGASACSPLALLLVLPEPQVSRTKPRSAGDWHRAAHVWLFCQATGELMLQQRAACKDSWPGLWDFSAAGHGAGLC